MATSPVRVLPLRGKGFALPDKQSGVWALAALVVCAVLQLSVVFNRGINWDEFYHYSLLHELAQGTLTEPLQTLFARVFAWAIELPGTGVDHIIAIRLAMFSCELVTLAAIVGIAARFSDRKTGILCALAYISAGYVFRHGTSFRFDPPTAALLMTALYVLLVRKLDFRAIIVTGLLLGTAGLWTLKAVLYMPAFVGAVWLRWNEHAFSRNYLGRVAAAGLAAAASFGVLYWLHSHGLGSTADAESERIVGAAATKMFSIGYQPYWPLALKAAKLAPLLTIFILAFPLVLWRHKGPTPERLALLGLFLPLTTLLFYHNTAPYYYAFMLPPVVVACCIVVMQVTARYGVAAIASVLMLNGALMLVFEPASPVAKQRALVRAADEIFGRPVAYFDSYAMLGRFPKANVFMTPWGTEQYLAGAYPSLRQTMATRTVPLLIDDDGRFSVGLNSVEANPNLLSADQAALRATYTPFWGPYWLAGKVVRGDGRAHVEEFYVPGPYTVRDAPLRVDGRLYQAGDIVQIERGMHRLEAATSASGRLVWGIRLKPPAMPPPAEPYWVGF